MTRIERARKALRKHKEHIRAKALGDIALSAKEFLSYTPDSGDLIWTKGHRKGKKAGTKDIQSGYVKLTLCRRTLRAHRVAWFLHYGKDPIGHIDHINGDRADNRINNLRVVGDRENNLNDPKHRTGWLPGAQKIYKDAWSSSISVGNRKFYLGVFSSAEEAHEAYMAVLKEG